MLLHLLCHSFLIFCSAPLRYCVSALFQFCFPFDFRFSVELLVIFVSCSGSSSSRGGGDGGGGSGSSVVRNEMVGCPSLKAQLQSPHQRNHAADTAAMPLLDPQQQAEQ